MADYFSFEDVMRELELSEEDLKRMVSEGELRAFRDENKMKFKREDVDNLKKGRITEPTIILPSTPGAQQDETVLDLDIQEEQAALSADAGPSGSAGDTAPPSAETDDLMLAPTEGEKVGSETEETFIEEESDTGLTTEPLKLADEVESAETVETETVGEEAVEEEKPSKSRRVSRRMVAVGEGVSEEELETRRPGSWVTATLIAAFVLAGYSMFFVQDLLMMENGRQEQPSGLTAGFAKWTLNQFWGDANWRKFHEREYPPAAPPYKIDENTPTPDESIYKGPSFQLPDRFTPRKAQ